MLLFSVECTDYAPHHPSRQLDLSIYYPTLSYLSPFIILFFLASGTRLFVDVHDLWIIGLHLLPFPFTLIFQPH